MAAAAKTKTAKKTAAKAVVASADTPNLDEVRTPEHKMRMNVGRTIGRGVWLAKFKADNPTASKDDVQIAWEEVRKEYAKIGLKALKTLEKTGFRMVEANG